MSSGGDYQISEVQTRKRTCCQKFLRFLFNPDSKEFCGRTCLSWLSIIVFYIVFYACLAGFFAAILAIYVHGVLNKSTPFLTGQQSLLRGGPGVAIGPLVRTDKNDTIASTLIYANLSNTDLSVGSNNTKLIQFKDTTDLLLNAYRGNNSTPTGNRQLCDETSSINDTDITKACFFNISSLGPCKDPVKHLVENGKLCVFITMNKIYGWLPELQGLSTKGPLIECFGQYPADKENAGNLSYYPADYNVNSTTTPVLGVIPHYFFPFLRQVDYMTPIVAVEFANLKPDVVVQMKCRVTNVPADVGESPFEVMVDSNITSAVNTISTTTAGITIAVTTTSGPTTAGATTAGTTTAAAGSNPAVPA